MPKKDIHYFALTTPMDYHYNPDDEFWYDVDTEEPPLPISKAVFDNNFKINYQMDLSEKNADIQTANIYIIFVNTHSQAL